ncbi:aryl-sulfate sulfotransferase [Sorangium sp. So ce296]|uniref:aryl-sulfate sulfotransferase n=1 Tax=Sorangium sp. So ce296 TaxID=3133296 RepID=UPI003F62D08E
MRKTAPYLPLRAPTEGWLLSCSLAACSAVLWAGCGTREGPAPVGRDTTPPAVITGPELHAVPAPLARKLTVATDEPTQVTITIDDGVKPTELKIDSYANSHVIPVLGLTFDTPYTVSVTVTDQAGNRTEAGSGSIPPISPPELFPPIEKIVTGSSEAEQGFVLFTPASTTVENDTMPVGYVTIVDNNGDVVWFYEAPAATEVLRLSNGNLLIQSAPEHHASMLEVDMLGQTVRTWVSRKAPSYGDPSSEAIKVDVDTFHHDVRVMPNGNFVTMSTELQHVEDYPTEETNVDQTLAPANFVNPTLAEFEPDTGKVVHRWSVTDADSDHIVMSPPVDHKRVGYKSLRNIFWADVYGPDVGGNELDCGADGVDRATGAGTCYDWGHFNTFWYDERTDSFLLSLRHLGAIASFNRSTGALDWLLGNHNYWSPELTPYLLDPPAGATARFWPYYAHRVTMTKARTVMMMDNHNLEAIAPDPPLPARDNNSRVAEYAVQNGGVQMVWEYEHPLVPGDEVNTNLYSSAVGGALEMPQTGNILIDFGGICKVPDESIKPPGETGSPGEPSDNNNTCKHWARIIEVKHDDSKKVVFDIRVGDNDLTRTVGWYVYRATKLRCLHPQSPTC